MAKVARARSAVMFLLDRDGGLDAREIGMIVRRHRTTVIAACRTMRLMIAASPTEAAYIEGIRKSLGKEQPKTGRGQMYGEEQGR